jgi:hypothetical protein
VGSSTSTRVLPPQQRHGQGDRETDFGTQSFERVVPGQSVHHLFTITKPTISAGTVNVAATGHAPLSSTSATATAGYGGVSCA